MNPCSFESGYQSFGDTIFHEYEGKTLLQNTDNHLTRPHSVIIQRTPQSKFSSI
jgi:hypothetical protein